MKKAVKRVVNKGADMVNKGADKAKENAKKAADKASRELQTLMTDLENKLATFEKKVINSRGQDADNSKTEVAGGRTVMRVSEMRASTSEGMDDQIKGAIGSFIQLAQGGEAAKTAAVDGAKNIITGSIDAIFGVSQGKSMEKVGFCVLFLNYAFVRVDYFIYSYNVSAAKFGAKVGVAGCCYLADLTVLKLESLHSSEIDFLVAQSLHIQDMNKRVMELTAIKMQLAQSAVLSRLLLDKEQTADMQMIKRATEKYVQSQMEIKKLFQGMPDFIPAAN